jgi:hypothetical protein
LTFTPASTPSLAAFLTIIYFIVGFFLEATWRAEKRLNGNPGKRVAQFSFLLGTLLGVMAFFVKSGLLASHPMPFLPVFLLFMLGSSLAFGFSKFGGSIAFTTPIWILVAFQVFRLPLELVLHSWAEQGTIPQTMTWTGQNLDILSGLVALAAVGPAVKHRSAAWLANVVGILLLANVARVAVMSSPLPFAWGTSPPLLLAYYFPYALIVPICVGGALAGHVILTRALLRKENA